MKIQLLSDQMLVELCDPPADVTPPQGLVLTNYTHPANVQYAKVLACGPGRLLESCGQVVPMPCKVGQLVVTVQNPGTVMKVEGFSVRHVYARDLIGVVPE